MSDNITAKEAFEISTSSAYDSVKETISIINKDIKIIAGTKKTSLNTIISKDGIDSNGLSFIVSDLEDRGFKVRATDNGATYHLEITWD